MGVKALTLYRLDGALEILKTVKIETDNPKLKARIAEVARLRADKRPTVPTTIAAELAENPFLRAEVPAVQAAVGMKGGDPAAVFGEIRARKDRF